MFQWIRNGSHFTANESFSFPNTSLNKSFKEYARRAISRAKRHNSAQAVAVDAAVTIVPNFDMLDFDIRFEEKKICDQRFKHKEGCEWQFKYTKAEFQAFHRNKRVWEHIIDYYTINSNYQRYGKIWKRHSKKSKWKIWFSGLFERFI